MFTAISRFRVSAYMLKVVSLRWLLCWQFHPGYSDS